MKVCWRRVGEVAEEPAVGEDGFQASLVEGCVGFAEAEEVCEELGVWVADWEVERRRAC